VKQAGGMGAWIVIHGIFVGALWLFSLWAYPNLPDRYPVHFDFAGNPNRWVAGSSPEWFLVPGIATFLNAMFIGIALTLPRTPVEIMSLPNKDKFLKLPRDKQVALLSQFGQMFLVIVLGLNILLGGVQGMIYAVAQGSAKTLNAAPLLVIPVLIFVVLLVWSVKITRNIRRASDDWEARGKGDPG
jgi:uncharacterized membrane protein